MIKVDKTDPDYSLYFYGDKEKKKGYIGITINPEQREYQHRMNKKKQKFFEDCNPMFEVLKRCLDYDTASNEEQQYIADYINNGWSMANKVIRRGHPRFYGKMDSINNVRYYIQHKCHNSLTKFFKDKTTPSIPKNIVDEIITEYTEGFMKSDIRHNCFEAYMERTKQDYLSAEESFLGSPEYNMAYECFFTEGKTGVEEEGFKQHNVNGNIHWCNGWSGKSVEMVAQEYKDVIEQLKFCGTDNEIAKLCGVSKPTVKKVRKVFNDLIKIT